MLKAFSVAAAATLAAAVITSPAAARDDGAIAAGIIGGLAVGAVIGSQVQPAPRHYYGGPAYSHQYYEPVYGACHWEREQFVDRWGNYRVRRIQVCD